MLRCAGFPRLLWALTPAQAGLRLGYTWHDDKYDVAVFCRNCTNEIRNIYDIDFDTLTGVINDPRIVGAQLRVKF